MADGPIRKTDSGFVALLWCDRSFAPGVSETFMFQQLNPPLPMSTPRGPGLAHFLIDYGPESHLMWVVFLDEDGQCWTVPNPEIRMAPNWSLGRRPKKPGPTAVASIR